MDIKSGGHPILIQKLFIAKTIIKFEIYQDTMIGDVKYEEKLKDKLSRFHVHFITFDWCYYKCIWCNSIYFNMFILSFGNGFDKGSVVIFEKI